MFMSKFERMYKIRAVSYLENAVLSLELNFRRDRRIWQLALWRVEWVFPPAGPWGSRGRSWHGVILFTLLVFSKQLGNLILRCYRINGRLVILYWRVVGIVVTEIHYMVRRLRWSAPHFWRDGPLRTLFFGLYFREIVRHCDEEENWLEIIVSCYFLIQSIHSKISTWSAIWSTAEWCPSLSRTISM